MSYDLRLALMSGIDIPIVECNLVLHQPTIKEISYIGESVYLTGIQSLCVDKSLLTEDETLLAQFNNFQVFMMIMTDKTSLDKKKAVDKVLPLLFPNYKVTMMIRALVFIPQNSEDMQAITIDENNFNILQEAIKQICCLSHSSMQQAGYNPQSRKAKEIADKLMKARAKIAAQNGENTDASIFGQYVSTLTIGIKSMTLTDCLNLTMYQLFDLIERYSLYTAWDLDIRVRLAGGSNDREPENWMKNIH